MTMPSAHLLTWGIIVIATAGVIVRPFRLPEAIWAVTGAVILVGFGLLPISAAFRAVMKGNDVYLFLTGMMLLSETARREGLFDWVATCAVNAAKGSPKRLFLLVYGVGTVVTVFLSNDATAVVLTPAVFAATRKARIEPLPFLLVCALIANAASFVLPISNPANLVLYGSHIPPLGERRGLEGRCDRELDQPTLQVGGWTALAGIGLTALVLLTVSAFDIPLGLPTAIMGVLTALSIAALRGVSPWAVIKDVSWMVLPLVAGLFVLVEALGRTGVVDRLAIALRAAAISSDAATAAGAGGLVALVSNLINNLPAGLIARSLLDVAHASQRITDGVLIGVDLGPNLSITGSLATILWLSAIRREGQDVSFGRFLKVGIAVMPPALLLALGARLLIS
jgi:arsenical pump membrane protein